MDRRSFLQVAASGVLLGSLGSCVSGKEDNRRTSLFTGSSSKKSPNVILLLADDMRWDALGAAGNRIIHTPNLDALVGDGVLFANNFVTTSICPTSRVSILTGQYARRHKVWDFSTALNPEQFRLSYPSLFRQAGYQTAFIGKWGIGGALPESEFDYWRGFEGQGYYFDPAGQREEHLTSFLGKQTLEFLDSVNSSQPFCLSVSFKAPHVQDGDPDPFKPDPKFSDLYEQVTIPRPPTASEQYFERLPAFLRDSEGRQRWQQRFSSDELYQDSVKKYYRLITGLDEAVGKIIAALKDKNLYDETYIIFTSDNGFFLGEHGLAGKWWGYEESIRTPLIVKPVEKSRVSFVSAMTLNIDLFPTLVELAGVSIPKSTQGISLKPLIEGTELHTRTEWFYEHLFEHPAIAKSEGIRTDRYKYLTYLDQEEQGEFFFDLYQDPYEERNLISDPSYQTLLQQNKRQLQRIRADLG